MSNSKLRTAAVHGALILALTSLFVLGQAASSRAASITWGTPIGIAGVGDVIVSTDGVLVTAINFDADSTEGLMPRTVNTVTFAAQNSLTGWNDALFNADLYEGGNVGSDFERMLDSFVFGDNAASPSATETLALSGLTPNTIYQAQFFVSDDRSASDLNTREQNFTGGDNTSATTANGPGYSLIGTFVADGASQLISITGFPGDVATGNPILNAYQVRELGAAAVVPEPSTALLAAIGIVGLIAFARRKKKNAG